MLLRPIFCLLGAILWLSCAPSDLPRVTPTHEVKPSPSIASSSTPAGLAAETTSLGVAMQPTDDSLELYELRDSLSVPGNPEPQIPMVFADVCPGEGCQYGKWIACDTFRVLTEPRNGAPVAFTLHRSDSLDALTGNQIVERAGKIIFRDTVRVQVMSLFNSYYLFTPADTLYPLAYDGEGLGTWYFHGRVGGGDWFFSEDEEGVDNRYPSVVVVRTLLTHWWVKAKNREGKTGWFEPAPGKIAGNSPHYEDQPPRCK